MKQVKKQSPIMRMLAHALVGISDLKRNPAAVFKAAEGRTLLVMTHSRPVAYIVPTETWEQVVDAIRDLREVDGARERLENIYLP